MLISACGWCIAAAYKYADGKKIDGRRVLVDVERGRTIKGWRPRRLGKTESASGLVWISLQQSFSVKVHIRNSLCKLRKSSSLK